MFIIGLVLTVVAIVAFLMSERRGSSDNWSWIGMFSMVFGIVLLIVGGLLSLITYYDDYPKLEAFYDINGGNYRMVVENQNEIAVMDLKGPIEGEFFDGSDFSQSRSTSDRYQEYRDAANEYNLELVKYRCWGGSFLFWPLPQPDSRLKPIKIK